MKLKEAQQYIREVHTKSFTWLQGWGISTIKEAIYTVFNRKSSTEADKEVAEDINRKIYMK